MHTYIQYNNSVYIVDFEWQNAAANNSAQDISVTEAFSRCSDRTV